MVVAFDAVGPSSAGAGTGSPGPLNFTHTAIATGVAILLGVGYGHATGADGTLAPTCGGVAMTPLGVVANNNSTGGQTLLFGIANRPSGANAISVPVSGGAALTTIVGGSISYSGADLTAPFGTPVTAFGFTAAPAVTVPASTAGNMLTGVSSSGGGGVVNPATSRYVNNFASTSAAGNIGGADKAAGGSVTFTWAVTSDWWGAIAVEIKVPGGAPTGIQPWQLRMRRPAHFTRLIRQRQGATYGR